MAAPSASGKETKVRRRILEAALEVAQAGGSIRRTMREVCRRAGCSPSMVQYHFGGKAGLFRAAQERCFDPPAAEAGKQSGQAMVSAVYVRLWELYGQVRRMARAYPDAFRVLRGSQLEELGPYPYVWECRKRLIRTIGDLIAQGVAGGDLRPSLDREAVADWFLLFCLGAEEGEDAISAMETLARFDLFWRGIAHPLSMRCRPTLRRLA